jgi:tetratricopeptide (TPR) repeat protein
MSFKVNSYSRTGLALCLVFGLASSGCAGWNKLIGKKDEPSPNLNLRYGQLKESEGNLTEARHKYEQVLAKAPNNAEAVLGMARLNMKAQRLVEAEEGYIKALALKPKSPAVLNEIGNFYSDQQRWDKAIPLLKECQRIEPHEKNYQFNLAVALAKSGQTKEALPHFKEAVGEAAAHYNIGRILIEKGNKKEAEEQFAIAVAKDPKLADARYFLEEIRTGNPSSPISPGSPSKAQQLPTVVEAARPDKSTQQVAATAPVKTAQTPNPFEEETQAFGFSRSDNIPALNISKKNEPEAEVPRPNLTPSGRQPIYPHQGYEELSSPIEYSNGGADQRSTSARAYASSIIQASAEEPANETRAPQSNSAAMPPRRIVPHCDLPAPGTTGARIGSY